MTTRGDLERRPAVDMPRHLRESGPVTWPAAVTALLILAVWVVALIEIGGA